MALYGTVPPLWDPDIPIDISWHQIAKSSTNESWLYGYFMATMTLANDYRSVIAALSLSLRSSKIGKKTSEPKDMWMAV